MISKPTRALALTALCGLLALNLSWLSSRWFPAGYDELTHLQHAQSVYIQMRQDGPKGALEALMGRYDSEERGEYWPGALFVGTAPALATSHGHPQGPLLMLVPLLALLTACVADAARRLCGPEGAAMAVWAMCLPVLTPMTFRHYLPVVAVVSLVGLGNAILARSDGLRRWRWVALWGCVVGLGLMSDRLVFLPLIGLCAPALFVSRPSWRGAAGLSLAGLLAACLAGPFYLRWWQSWGATVGQALTMGDGGGATRLLSWFAWLVEAGLGPPATVALALGLVWAPWSQLRRSPDAVLWLASLAGAVVLLAGSDSAQQYLAAGCLAPLAVLGGWGWATRLRQTPRESLSLALLLSLGACIFHILATGLGSGQLLAWDPYQDRRGPQGMRAGWGDWHLEGDVWREDALPPTPPASPTPSTGQQTPAPTPAPDATPTPTPRPPPLSDDEVFELLGGPGPVAVLDLVQSKELWSGIWLRYRTGLEPAFDALFPLRRRHARWAAEGSFFEDPCAFGTLLVVHHEHPWSDDEGLAGPEGYLGMQDLDRRRWRYAAQRVQRCFDSAPPRRVPMGPLVSALTRNTQPAPPLGRCAGLPCPEETFEGPCPPDMALIPAGDYPLGRAADDHGADYALRPELATLAGVCMDRYEFPNKVGALPTVDVNHVEAARLCEERGRRLCTEREWEAACRGQAGRSYAYGQTYDPTRCYTEGAPSRGADALEPIGSRPGCASPEGVHDLNGGVAELVADTVPGPPFPPDEGEATGACAVVRGGTMWGAAYGQDCTSRHWHLRDHRQDDDGFRCCRDPEP